MYSTCIRNGATGRSTPSAGLRLLASVSRLWPAAVRHRFSIFSSETGGAGSIQNEPRIAADRLTYGTRRFVVVAGGAAEDELEARLGPGAFLPPRRFRRPVVSPVSTCHEYAAGSYP